MPDNDFPTSAAELAASQDWRLRKRNEKIAAIRERSGLSMDDLAKLMGYKGQSSIQRYLSPDYSKGFRPEVADRFKAALLGRGDPPIEARELERIFDGWAEGPDGSTADLAELFASHIESGHPAADFNNKLKLLGIRSNSEILSRLGHFRRSKAIGNYGGDERVVGLPLAEGDILVRLPKRLSVESAATVRDWIEHLIKLSRDEDDAAQK